MSNGPGIWVLGLGASVLLNLGVGAGLMAALQPQPIVDQGMPESRLNVEAQEVTRSTASEQTPQTDAAAETATKGATLGVGAIAQSVARPVAAPVEASQAQAPQTETAADLAPTSEVIAQARPVAQTPVAGIPTPVSAPAATLQTTTPISQTLPASPASAQIPSTESAAQNTPVLVASLPQAPSATAAPSQTPSTTAALSQSPDTTASPQQTPEVTAGKALLAFPADGPVDPISLAAFQSFTQPGSADTSDLRDSLSAALSLPCARMQVIFDPDTTTLQLTGHVPDASQRAPVLAALRAQMGSDIPVAENLLVLPAPQCGALTGIAGVGLPQSTDQITNPMIVGADTHARAFRYVAGEPLVLSLTAPDYPAYVYVDYFDADGNVIHLAPNAQTPLSAVTPKSALQVGANSADEPGLFVRIGPPYGQELAAAFASSVPLYEGTRPLVEPAGTYLSWLKDRVAQARANHADFKGEWVYFFVTTAAN